MTKFLKKGFTLMEVIVALAIMGILLAIGIPAATHYIKLAEFRKNEANAKTAYLAAESTLSWYRRSGEWEAFKEKITAEDKKLPNTTFTDDKRKGRIYAVVLDQNNAATGAFVHELLDGGSYDKSFFDGSIAIEIDIESGQVYSAFYGTRCKSLSYDGTDTDGVLNISAAGDNRAYENRRGRLLGYYSADDVVNVVTLNPMRLKVTTLHLVNSETLSLNWSGNSRHSDLEVKYEITFYDQSDRTELFSTEIDLYELKGADDTLKNKPVLLDLYQKPATPTGTKTDLGKWSFPLSYQPSGNSGGKFSLVLDAMMSAELLEAVEAAGGEPASREYSTSITRLKSRVPRLKDALDIYAEIEAKPVYRNGDLTEYRSSGFVRSNTENTLFEKGTKQGGNLNAGISRFRHLSNIRYYEKSGSGQPAVFTVTARNLDWKSVGVGFYDRKTGAGNRIEWNGSAVGDELCDFPSIQHFPANCTLQGNGAATVLSNLSFGEKSVADDETVRGIYKEQASSHYSEYIGLFCESEGAVKDLTFQNPLLHLGKNETERAESFEKLCGAGILCGRSSGKLENIIIRTTEKGQKAVAVYLKDRMQTEGIRPAGIGGFVGVLAGRDADGSITRLEDASVTAVTGLTMSGAVTGRVPSPPAAAQTELPEERAADYPYGIGGILGYAYIGEDVAVDYCKNYADVTGNLFGGGIAGNVMGGFTADDAQTGASHVSIKNSSNEGLILCSVRHEEADRQLEGRYFGGILGFGNQVQVGDSTSASGRAGNYAYDVSQKDQVLLGQYVGGIIGYGNSSRLAGCSTQKNGYILGSDYVGGIAGGLSNDAKTVITGNGSISVTTNAGYVIGNSYVGGIVGKNDGQTETTVVHCINNGVAAGYGRYIGGIAGYNGENGRISDCASYLSDYDGFIFNSIVKSWEAVGDCAGGLAGYNNGKVTFSGDDTAIVVKSVSGVVIGQDYVGGIIGFNDTKGELAISYQLVGGRIYAYGNAAGGCIGLNASEKILDNEISIKPESVTGNYYVGGCIGVNVVDLSQDTRMDGFRADNSLGSITGKAFTGGVIGYQRTYTKEQLQQAETGEIALLDYLEQTQGNGDQRRLLPEPNADGIPTPVLRSENTYCLTVSNRLNSSASLASDNNNIPIVSELYTGGIVGYCERNSKLKLINCKNSGNITKSDGSLRVSLKEYLKSGEVGADTESLGKDDVMISIGGGMIGANLDGHIIDHCSNTGTMNGFVGLGGIVGFNAGGVFNCALSDNFGNEELDYIGGIAGLNVRSSAKDTENQYTDVNRKLWRYRSGMVAMCETQAGRNVTGRSCVGGIAGYNMEGAILDSNTNRANVTAAGDYAGGTAGVNDGEIRVSSIVFSRACEITGSSGTGIGGVAGYNRESGSVTASGGKEAVPVGETVSIIGKTKVGGIIGINEGILTVSGNGSDALVCKAKLVHAIDGYAGGIVGEAIKKADSAGRIYKATNQSARVTADRGPAGGIVAVNGNGFVLEECKNQGNVNSDQGNAGGIAAENDGQIKNCTVGEQQSGKPAIEISSQGERAIGAVTAINRGTILESVPVGGVMLSGTAQIVGGVAGTNMDYGFIQGTQSAEDISDATIRYMPTVAVNAQDLTVGVVAGQNKGAGNGQETAVIQNMTANGISFSGFTTYRYLGGIVGENQAGAKVLSCAFYHGSIEQTASSMAGNCYGGIAGKNSGALDGCRIGQITLHVKGVYTATSSSTAGEKESLASHVGGVAGKNEEGGTIYGCLIVDSANSMLIDSGMAGGVAGYNKGTIEFCGDIETVSLMRGAYGAKVTKVQDLIDAAKAAGCKADGEFVSWRTGELEKQPYNQGNEVSAGRNLSMRMEVNGNIGGICAYNAPTGQLAYCATGNWYLNNKSQAIGVGTGGIIGMNESEKDLSFLLNCSFVGRQISSRDTNRFAGGIIGNQNNSTSSGWEINSCINYGTVYCKNTHYSGGILGQWTGTGGTVLKCYNYGNLQTTCTVDWLGASGGIVAQLYHAYENHTYNIISCENYGKIFGRAGRSTENCANDSGGILGNVTTYRVSDATHSQKFTINVEDCVNGAGVEIYSQSMASGIVCFFSCDKPNAEFVRESTAKITLKIERCRNYASVLKGNNHVGGIFGDRYGDDGAKNTVVKHCFSVNRASGSYNKTNRPVLSFKHDYSRAGSVNFGSEETTIYNFFLSENTVNSFPTRTIRDNVANNDLQSGNSRWVYRIVKNGMQYYVRLELKIGNPAVDSITISDNQVLYDDAVVGEVLFKVPAGDPYADMASVVNAGSGFDRYVRELCYKKAGMLIAPEKVTLARTGKDFTLLVEASTYEKDVEYEATLYRKSADGTTNEVVRIEGNGGDSFTFEGKRYAFRISDADFDRGGEVFVRLFAKKKGTTDRSVDIDSNTVTFGAVPVTPEIRAELMGTDGNYRYRFKLVNADRFDGYDDWSVTVALMDGTTLTFDKTVTERLYQRNADALEQIIVNTTVTARDTDGTLKTAADETPIPVYLPKDVPEISLHKRGAATEKTATPGSVISGSSLRDLSITAVLTGNGGNVTTPPVYRADLIGTWKDAEGNPHTDTVLQSADILTTASGEATAMFTNLPEYAADASDIRLRVWYAQSGLGPVYSYYEVLENEAHNIASLTMETTTADDGTTVTTPKWEYAYSNVLNDTTFASYQWESPALFEWLPRPKLMELADGESLAYDLTEDGRLEYTFRWDETTYEAGAQYLVTLTGIIKNDDGSIASRVSIPTDGKVTGNSLTVDAGEWSYNAVEVSVTRKGDAAGTKKVGLTATETYPIRKRLPHPMQPRVSNPNINELDYTVEWDPIRPETGCVSYQIYIQPYAEDGITLEAGEPIRKENGEEDRVLVGTMAGGVYKKSVNMEAYAGRKVRIYLKAKAADGSEDYIESVEGISYELSIPRRLPAPNVAWTKNWDYNKTEAKLPEEFEDGLSVTVKPDSGSIPPGGSSYLLKAYLFDSKANAEAAKGKIDDNNLTGVDGLVATYPSLDANGRLNAVSMNVEAADRYSHTLVGLSPDYAGKYILFYTRISSGDGNVSSQWTPAADVWRLPYAKLAMPDVIVDSRERETSVALTGNPDLENTTVAWTTSHNALCWESVAHADAYYITLTDKSGAKTSFKLKEGRDAVFVSVKDDASGWTAAGSVRDRQEQMLSQYKNTVTGNYAADITMPIPCQADLSARLYVEKTEKGFAYTLILPDAKSASPESEIQIAEDQLLFTAAATVFADMEENEADPGSDAYIASQPYEVKFRN